MPCDAPVMTATFWFAVVMMLTSLSKDVVESAPDGRTTWPDMQPRAAIRRARPGNARAGAGSATVRYRVRPVQAATGCGPVHASRASTGGFTGRAACSEPGALGARPP